MKTTADQQLVKRINRSILLRWVQKQEDLSRAQLAVHSGLTKSTVSLLVRELIDEHWLTETPVTPALGLGRPSTPLQIDRQLRGLLGVEIAVETLRVVAVNLKGEVFWSVAEPLLEASPAKVCAQTIELIAKAHQDMVRKGVQLTGIGVGVPGAVDERTGYVRFAPNLGWRDVPILDQLRAGLVQVGISDLPLLLQNEADAAALSEYEFSGQEVESPLIFVTCDVGVGAGIVLNDRLFTGLKGLAGEIGHSVVQIDGPLCSCGRRGCVEAFIGARALGKLNDPQAGGRYLGLVLQNLWTAFDPSVIVLGGPSCVNAPALVQQARAQLQHYADSTGMAPPLVRSARYGLSASAVGAAALVLHDFLRPLHSSTASTWGLPVAS